MKIVIINGSPRTNGFTATILHSIEKELIQRGTDVAYFDLSKLTMTQCQGCCGCYKTGKCHIKDNAEMLADLIKEADGLVLGSPTYASNVSGYMKVLIDRGHFVIEQLLTNKHCITVTTGENYGCRDASKVLKNLVLYSGGQLVKTIISIAPFNTVRSETGQCYYEKIGRDAAIRLYKSIKQKSKNPFQSLFHTIIFSLGIKPFVIRKGPDYQGVIDKWKELKIYG